MNYDALRQQSFAATQAILDLIQPFRDAYAAVGQASFGDTVEATLQSDAATLSGHTTAWLINLENLSGGNVKELNGYNFPQNRADNITPNPYNHNDAQNPNRRFSDVPGVFGPGVPATSEPGDEFSASGTMPVSGDPNKVVVQFNVVRVSGQAGFFAWELWDDDNGVLVWKGSGQASINLKLGMNGNPNVHPRTRNLRPGGNYTISWKNTSANPNQGFFVSGSYTD